MTMFYRTDVRMVDNCREPALPDDVGLLVVVYGCDFAIVESDSLGSDLPVGVESITNCLEKLLHSSFDYPPARALAMEACEGADLDYPAMCQRLAQSLEDRFHSQPSDGFRFLRAAGEQLGYLTRGRYYWVLGYRNDNVKWVSSDYQIYTDHCSEFGLTEDQLPRLFPMSRNRTP